MNQKKSTIIFSNLESMDFLDIFSVLVLVLDCIRCGTVPFDSVLLIGSVYVAFPEAVYNAKVMQLGITELVLSILVCTYQLSIAHAIVQHVEPSRLKRFRFSMYSEARLDGYMSPFLTLYLCLVVAITHILLFVLYILCLEITGLGPKCIAPLVCVSSIVDVGMLVYEHGAIMDTNNSNTSVSWYILYGKEAFTTAQIRRCESWRWPLLDHFMFTSMPNSKIEMRDVVPMLYHYRKATVPSFAQDTNRSEDMPIDISSDDDDNDF